LVLNFALGRRNQTTTDIFIEGLRAATAPKLFQITTDGFQPYISRAHAASLSGLSPVSPVSCSGHSPTFRGG
jgi:hypothetical protein